MTVNYNPPIPNWSSRDQEISFEAKTSLTKSSIRVKCELRRWVKRAEKRQKVSRGEGTETGILMRPISFPNSQSGISVTQHTVDSVLAAGHFVTLHISGPEPAASKLPTSRVPRLQSIATNELPAPQRILKQHPSSSLTRAPPDGKSKEAPEVKLCDTRSQGAKKFKNQH